jgi:hypothetical protein
VEAARGNCPAPPALLDEVIDVANSWLLHRIKKDLLKSIHRAERKQAKRAAFVGPERGR